MTRYMNNNKHALHIQHYVMNCSIGDWFVLYQMSKNMNKRFFAEFIALLSLKINPDPYLSADPEIDILKRSDDEEGPNGDSGVGKYTDISSMEYYDDDESQGSQYTVDQEKDEETDGRKRGLRRDREGTGRMNKKSRGGTISGLKSKKAK